MSGRRSAHFGGFTIMELMVVLAIVALLLTVAVPRFGSTVNHAKEAVLRENLLVMRKALDQHFEDRGEFPIALSELVERNYLRAIPRDPMTDSAESWVLVRLGAATEQAKTGIRDIRSASEQVARDGSPLASW